MRMKKLYIFLAAAVLSGCLGLCAAAEEPWQEQYWDAYWDKMEWSFIYKDENAPLVSFADLNNDGVLELICSNVYDGSTSVYMIAAMADGKVNALDGGVSYCMNASGYRQSKTGEIRFFNFPGEHNVDFEGTIREIVLDWEAGTVSDEVLANVNQMRVPMEYFIAGQKVSEEVHKEFYQHFLRGWKKIPGLYPAAEPLKPVIPEPPPTLLWVGLAAAGGVILTAALLLLINKKKERK